MSDDEGKKLVSIFADSDVWIRVEVLHKLLDYETLKLVDGATAVAVLKETISHIERETIVTISNNMLDNLEEE